MTHNREFGNLEKYKDEGVHHVNPAMRDKIVVVSESFFFMHNQSIAHGYTHKHVRKRDIHCCNSTFLLNR